MDRGMNIYEGYNDQEVSQKGFLDRLTYNFSNGIKKFKKASVASAIGLTLAASSMVYSPKAKADFTTSMAPYTTQMILSAPANSGIDSDGDGLADAIDPYPNNVSGSNEYGFHDNLARLDIIIPDPAFSFSAINHYQIVPAITPQANKSHWAAGFSRDDRTLCFISTNADLTDPIFYKAIRGDVNSATPLTASGNLGAKYEFQKACPNTANNGFLIHVNTAGNSYGGKIVNVSSELGGATDYLVPSASERFLDPMIHTFSGIDYLFATVIDNPSDLTTSYIAAFPIIAGVPDVNQKRLIIDTNTFIRWPSISNVSLEEHPNITGGGAVLGFTMFFDEDDSGASHSFKGNLESVVTGASSSYTSGDYGVVDRYPGATFVGFTGQNMISCADFHERRFQWTAPSFINSDFDIRIHTLTGNAIIRYIGNQFFPSISNDAILAFSNDSDANGIMELYLANLETRVVYYRGLPGDPIPDPLICVDATGTRNVMSAGTVVNTPSGERTLTFTPSINLTRVEALPAGDVVTRTINGPNGTTFIPAGKAGIHGLLKTYYLNKYLMTKLGITVNDITAYDIDASGLGGLEIISRTLDPPSITVGMDNFSTDYLLAEYEGLPEGPDPGMPVANAVGLGALAAGAALTGAFALRKRSFNRS